MQGNRSGACNMPATTSQPSTAQPRRIDRVTGTCPVRRSDRNRKGAHSGCASPCAPEWRLEYTASGAARVRACGVH